VVLFDILKKIDALATSQSDVSPDGWRLVTGAGWRLTSQREEDKDFALRSWRLVVPGDK